MNFYLSTSLYSYIKAWEIYKVNECAEDLIIDEDDYNKMLEVIRGQGLEEKVDKRGFHRWYGTREEILRLVDRIEFSTHGGPSWEGYDDEMLQIIIDRSLGADSVKRPYTVYEV